MENGKEAVSLLFTTPVKNIAQKIYQSALEKDDAFIALADEFKRRSQNGPFPFIEGRGKISDRNPAEMCKRVAFFDRLSTDLSYDNVYISNGIHPIFRRENFENTLKVTDQAYDQMRTALRLATRMITTKEAQGWWIHVMYGSLAQDPVSGKYFLQKSPREKNLAQAYIDLEARWHDLSRLTKFYWSPNCIKGVRTSGIYDRNPMHRNLTLGGEERLSKFRKHPDIDKEGALFDCRIGLSCRHLYRLLSPVARSKHTLSSRMRVDLLIAETLVHELAHAFYDFTNIGKLVRDAYVGEPYIYLTDQMSEVGHSWSQWMFNMWFDEDYTRLDEVGPMIGVTPEVGYSWPSISSVISMQWVQAWFRPGTWERIMEFRARTFLVPQLAIGRPSLFVAEVYSGGQWTVIWYRRRRDEYEIFEEFPSEGEPPPRPPKGTGHVDIWFAEVTKQGKARAIQEGTSTEEDFRDFQTVPISKRQHSRERIQSNPRSGD